MIPLSSTPSDEAANRESGSQPQPPTNSVRSRTVPLWATACLSAGLALTLLAFSVLAGVYALTRRYEDNIKRADLLGESRHDGRDLGKVTGPLNILLIGSDTRAAEDFDPKDPSSSRASVPGERGDAVMLLHIPRSMDRGYVISIPRDA